MIKYLLKLMSKLKIIIENQQVLSNKNDNRQQNWLSDILCLGMCLILFYTLWLGSYPLFTPDEGRYSEVAREMVATGDFITPRVNGVAFLDKPALYYWLQAIAIQLFGIKEWALRLFPALIGVLSCLMMYICGRRLFDRRTGLLSAIILASTPLYFGGAHYANLDLEVAALISCSLLCFITGVMSKDKSRNLFLFAAYIFAALAFLTKGLIGFAFPSLIALSWMFLGERWDALRNIHLMKGIALAIAIVLPWYILVQLANPQFLHFFFITQQVTRFLSKAEFNNPTPFWFYAPVILLGFFPWTIFFIQAMYKHVRNVLRDKAHHQVELYLLLWIAIIFIFFSIPKCKMIGYILPIFPPIALLVGNYLSNAWDSKHRWCNFVFAVIGALLGIMIIAAQHYQLFEMRPSSAPYLNIMAAIFIISAVISLWFIKKRTLLSLFTLCLACSVMFLFTLILSAEQFNTNSIKPLIMNLKTIMQPEDEVIHFYKFYQDVPIYLEKRVTIVANWNAPDIVNNDNWLRELWFGMPFQKTDDWLIDKEKFWQRWNSDRRVFVFISTNYFPHFQRHADHYYVIGKYNHVFLLSNKPTYLSFLTPSVWAKKIMV